MSAAEEPEYEVESVVAAKVVTLSQAKKRRLGWKYLVRWKGYSANDDTWEPIESFNGSEHLVEAFWSRCSTRGRDTTDISLFKAGEEFVPVGPPRHKTKPKSSSNISPPAPAEEPSDQATSSLPTVNPSPVSTRKRRREHSDLVEILDKPVKRVKNSTVQSISSASSSKLPPVSSTRSKGPPISSSIPSISARSTRFRKPSPSEIVPDSDEERNEILRMPLMPTKPAASSSTEKREIHPRQESPIVIEDDSPLRVKASNPAPDPEEESQRKQPVHRARLANPRVKLIESPQTPSADNAARKTRASARRGTTDALPAASAPSSSARPSRARPGPGRSSTGLIKGKNVSSLLVGTKGSLKTLKGKYAKPATLPDAENSKPSDVDSMDVDVELPPPSSEELLKLACHNTEAAEDLDDFEEDDADPNLAKPNDANTQEAKDEMTSPATPDKKEQQQQQQRKESLDKAKNNLFPDPRPSLPAVFNVGWGRSTIFGPLTLGSDATKEESPTSCLFLNLDTSLAIPTSVSDASQTVRKSLSTTTDSKQVPGKFYGTEAALSLLATIRATGESATIAITGDATAEQKKHFELFFKRLEDGEIFVSMAGAQIIVFSSSSSTLLSSRLNTPAAFLNQPGKVILSYVNVENPSGFADATVNADPRRWEQYVAAVEK